MRRTSKPQLLKNEQGEGVVLCLGADFCAEHEWGIKDVNEYFGIPLKATSKVFGIQARAITQLPKEGVLLLSHTNKVALVFDPYLNWQIEKGESITWKHLSAELRAREDDTLQAAWDQKSFGVIGCGEDVIFLKRLHQAFLDKDVAIWLGGGGPFENAGLCIGITSLIPDEGKKTMADADLDRIALQEATDKTGIIARLDAAKCRSYACSARWASEKEKERTKYPIIFWLNPVDQNDNNYGWFTIEELEQWIKGIGPIPKVGRLETLIKEGKTVEANRKGLWR